MRADEIEFLIEKRNRYINDLILFPRYDGENFHAVNDKSQFSHATTVIAEYNCSSRWIASVALPHQSGSPLCAVSSVAFSMRAMEVMMDLVMGKES